MIQSSNALRKVALLLLTSTLYRFLISMNFKILSSRLGQTRIGCYVQLYMKYRMVKFINTQYKNFIIDFLKVNYQYSISQ